MAKTPRSKKQTSERSATSRRRAPSTLAVTVFLLLAGAASLAAWLSYSYEPAVVQSGTPEAVLPIDLSKEGRGEQAAPVMAIRPDEEPTDTKPTPEKQVPAPPADIKAGEKPGKPETPAQAGAEDHRAAPVTGPTAPGTGSQASGSETPQHRAPPATTAGQQPAPQVFQDTSEKDAADRPAKSAGPAPSVKPGPAGKLVPLTAEGGLRPAPDPDLIKSTESGPLPVVAPDGRTPLQVYARPYKATGRPRIAVVVGSLGLSQATTMAAIQQLPGGVTLAFAPYGRNLQDYVNQARAAGHEVLLQVPMEPMDYPTNDPGPHTLLTSLTINHNLKRLDWLLGRFAGYVGVVNFMGGRFTAAESHVRPILEAMRDRGLMFLDSRASSSSVADRVAGKIGLTIAVNDRVVDAVASRAAIDARLLELERLASASGGAIGIGFPYPVTIERLAQWTRVMGDRGYDLVPISSLADYQEAKP